MLTLPFTYQIIFKIAKVHVLELTVLFDTVAVNINFEESSYSVTERRNRPVQPVLILSNPSSTSITVTIVNIDVNATGMYSLVIL